MLGVSFDERLGRLLVLAPIRAFDVLGVGEYVSAEDYFHAIELGLGDVPPDTFECGNVGVHDKLGEEVAADRPAVFAVVLFEVRGVHEPHSGTLNLLDFLPVHRGKLLPVPVEKGYSTRLAFAYSPAGSVLRRRAPSGAVADVLDGR